MFSSTLAYFVPSSQAKPEPPNPSKFWQKCWATLLSLKWYNIGSGLYVKYFYTDPDQVEINYLGNVTVNLTWGVENSKKNPWHRFNPNVTKEFTIIYDAIFPKNISKNAFHAVFNPPTFDVAEYDRKVGGTSAKAPQPTTKLTLSLDIPPEPSNPIQDFVLKINVTIIRKYGDLITYLSGNPDVTHLPLPLLKIKNSIAMLSGHYLKANYLAETKQYHYNVSLFVKVKPFHNAVLYMPTPIEMGLNDCKAAHVQVQNRGSHIEQFGFRVTNRDSGLLVNTPPPVSLYPGETGDVEVGLVAKPVAYDHGTLHSINVTVYSCDQPNIALSSGILSVRTKGFVLSNVPDVEYFWHVFFTGLIIFFFAIFILINHRRKLAQICKKPPKPWTVPKEKEYLERLLKEKKTKEYETTRKMMKQEYISALLWYKNYRKSLIRKGWKQGKLRKLIDIVVARFSDIFKKIEKKEQAIEQKIIETKPEEVKKKEIAEEIAEREKQKREKTLQKIKRQQQKQKRKLGI